MNWKSLLVFTIFLLLTAILAQAAMAESDPSVTSDKKADSGYLSSLSTSQGDLTLLYKISEKGTEAPFYNLYQDSFPGDSFYIDRFAWRGWHDSSEIYRFNVENSWDTSQNGSFDWHMPYVAKVWGRLDHFDHFEVPQSNRAGRTDLTAGFEAGKFNDHAFNFNYTFRKEQEADAGVAHLADDWKTNDFNMNYKFKMKDWNTSLEFSHRSVDDVDINDVTHTSGAVKVGRDVGKSTYLQGNVAYGTSNVKADRDLTTFVLGGYGRFANALGVDRFNVTSKLDWTNQSKGPSRTHPAGDLFKFDLYGKYQACPNLRFTGSWNLYRADYSHPDEVANIEFRTHPEKLFPEQGLILSDTITTNDLNFGGWWAITKALDANAGWTWVSRNGLPATDLSGEIPDYLVWNTEMHSMYALKWHAKPGWANGTNNWLLKYTADDKSNSERDASSDADHLTLNWSGMLSENVTAYAGAGIFRTHSSLAELDSYAQRGKEYGAGLDCTLAQGWDFYADYWKYDVTHSDLYNQTTYSAGLSYDMDKYMTWTLAYDRSKGDFDNSDIAGFDAQLFLLKLTLNLR